MAKRIVARERNVGVLAGGSVWMASQNLLHKVIWNAIDPVRLKTRNAKRRNPRSGLTLRICSIIAKTGLILGIT